MRSTKRELERLEEMEQALDQLADLLAEEGASHRLTHEMTGSPGCEGAAEAYEDCVTRINAILHPDIPGSEKP